MSRTSTPNTLPVQEELTLSLAKNTRFPSWIIKPKDRRRKTKRVYVASFGEENKNYDYIELLKKEGLRPCRGASHFLLCLMEKIQEENMPEELNGKNIVAANPDDDSSLFLDQPSWAGNGMWVFLCVRREDGRRHFAYVAAYYRKWEPHWAFISEEIITP